MFLVVLVYMVCLVVFDAFLFGLDFSLVRCGCTDWFNGSVLSDFSLVRCGCTDWFNGSVLSCLVLAMARFGVWWFFLGRRSSLSLGSAWAMVPLSAAVSVGKGIKKNHFCVLIGFSFLGI